MRSLLSLLEAVSSFPQQALNVASQLLKVTPTEARLILAAEGWSYKKDWIPSKEWKAMNPDYKEPFFDEEFAKEVIWNGVNNIWTEEQFQSLAKEEPPQGWSIEKRDDDLIWFAKDSFGQSRLYFTHRKGQVREFAITRLESPKHYAQLLAFLDIGD